MNLSKLKEPFHPDDIEWRVQQAGSRGDKPWAKVLAYVTNRAIMERLDEICGPENWRNEYAECPGGGIMCGLSVLIGGEWVTKWDGADKTQVEATKGGLSGAMKRAAVQWGIGRYLYKLDAAWAVISPNGKNYQPAKQGKYKAFNWDAPTLPTWAMPSGVESQQPQSQPVQKVQETFPGSVELATDAQIKKIMATINELTKDAPISDEQRKKNMNAWLVNQFPDAQAVSSTKELTKQQAGAFIEYLESRREN